MVLKKKRGVALISVLLILSFMMALTMGFVWYTMQDHLSSVAFNHANICFYLAQAGQEYVMFLMKHNMMIFPTYPTSDNYANSAAALAAGRDKNYKYMDEPYLGALDPDENWRYTWVGREESLGPNRTTGSSSDDMNLGNDGENNYDDWTMTGIGSDNVIDCTEIVLRYDTQSTVMMRYDADKNDGSTTIHNAGDIINIFKDEENDANKKTEFLVMSRLTLGDDNAVGLYLDSEYACGTFKVVAEAPQDSTKNNKTILVTSTGMVKQIPRNQLNNDPDTWTLESFNVLSRRTIMARIPYYAPRLIDRGYVPDNPDDQDKSHMLNKTYIMTPERWFDRFR